MADVHSPAIRSKNMRAIRNRNTAIEQHVATLLTEIGLAFKVQDQQLPGKPDIVLGDYQAVIFVHGCFWHRHFCPLFVVPATRTTFWLTKIASNVERDQCALRRLHAAGWKVLIIWECALRGKRKLADQALMERLEEWVLQSDHSIELDYQGMHVLGG